MADDDPIPPELQRTLTTEEMIYIVICAIAERLEVGPRAIIRHTREYLKIKAEDEGHDPDAEGRS